MKIRFPVIQAMSAGPKSSSVLFLPFPTALLFTAPSPGRITGKNNQLKQYDPNKNINKMQVHF